MPEKKMINVRLNPAVWARAKAAASEQGITLERWVTDALESHLIPRLQPREGVAGSPAGNASTDGPPEGDLAWRVAALEAAVDYLAGAIGVGFPGGLAPAPPHASTGARESSGAGGTASGSDSASGAPGGAEAGRVARSVGTL